jgi:hypothetical protein
MPVYDFEDWVAWIEANDHDLWKKALSTDIRKVDIFLQDHYELYINGKRKESLFLRRWRQPYIKNKKNHVWYNGYVNLITGNKFPCTENIEFVGAGHDPNPALVFPYDKIKKWCLMSTEELPGSYLVEEGWCKILPFDDKQSIKLSEVRAYVTSKIMNESLALMYS